MGNHFYVTPPDKKDSHPYRYDKEWLYLSYFSKSLSYIVELLRLKSLSLSPLSQTSFFEGTRVHKSASIVSQWNSVEIAMFVFFFT